MSTRCYDTDLNAAAWAWIAPYLPAARSGGRPRTTDTLGGKLVGWTMAVMIRPIFYLLRTGPILLELGGLNTLRGTSNSPNDCLSKGSLEFSGPDRSLELPVDK